LACATLAAVLRVTLVRADEGAGAGAQADHKAAAPSPTSPAPPAEWGPEIDDWPPGKPPPAGYHVSSRSHPRAALVDSGAALLVIPYALSFAIAAIGNENLFDPHDKSTLWLFCPVAGPLVLMGTAPDRGERILLGLDGGLQALGAGLIALGLTWRIPILERDRGLVLAPAPLLVGGRPRGLALTGAF
jgi:hypothetical protein